MVREAKAGLIDCLVRLVSVFSCRIVALSRPRESSVPTTKPARITPASISIAICTAPLSTPKHALLTSYTQDFVGSPSLWWTRQAVAGSRNSRHTLAWIKHPMSSGETPADSIASWQLLILQSLSRTPSLQIRRLRMPLMPSSRPTGNFKRSYCCPSSCSIQSEVTSMPGTKYPMEVRLTELKRMAVKRAGSEVRWRLVRRRGRNRRFDQGLEFLSDEVRNRATSESVGNRIDTATDRSHTSDCEDILATANAVFVSQTLGSESFDEQIDRKFIFEVGW